jgi:tetratricopeptide (TPR) repeat protein
MRSALCLSLFASVAFAEAPLSLTASDGTGLKLEQLKARAVLDGPLAFTELHLIFSNPQDRQIEGTFHMVLPPLATVSRFAMKLEDRWQEGEVVEKQAARRAYEDFLHRRQDPALLEQSGGNAFDARVFPIPARGKKEIIVSYSHAPEGPYVLPLKGLPAVSTLDVSAYVDGRSAATLQKQGYSPENDFKVELSKDADKALRAGDYLVARVSGAVTGAADPVESVAILFDTSASRALGFSEQITLLQKIAAGLAKSRVALAAFDQTVQPIYDGPASGVNDGVLKQLKTRRALGASDLEAALKWSGTTKATRVLLISDGVATAGAAEGDVLMAAVKGLKASGVQRLDAIALGGLRDVAALKQLVTAGLPRDGAVIDGDKGADEALRRLNARTFSKLAIALDGAKFVWPRQVDGLQPGDSVLVVAELPAAAPIKLTFGGNAVSLAPSPFKAEPPMLERAVVQGKLQELQDRIDRVADGPKQKGELKAQAVKLSTQYRVLCPYTALLVLETEQDYARFGIDRRALADILVVNDGRLGLQKRAADTVPVAKTPPPQPPAKHAADEKPMAMKVAPKPTEKKKMAKEEAGDNDSDGVPDLADREDAAPPPGAPPPPSPRPSPVATADAPPPPPAAEPAPVMRDEAPPRSMMGRSANMSGAPTMNQPQSPAQELTGAPPYEGIFKQVMEAIAAKKTDDALAKARGWREEQPGDVLALVALGEALEASGNEKEAARAYGSIIDLFPGRADLRRFAGARLERLKSAEALKLAVDAFSKAAEQRADHPASHRLLAYMLLKLGEPGRAFTAIEKGLAQRYPEGRFRGVDRILHEDAALIAAAWIKAEPARRGEILEKLKKYGVTPEDQPSLRFVLNWETDGNDVDFHIVDGQRGHAFYSAPHLPSGGDLYADVTTGYGPECFTIRNTPGTRAYPYKLAAHYYSRGPMGYGMGKLEIIDHDGKGGMKFVERPYVVMVDQAFVDLGTVDATTLK